MEHARLGARSRKGPAYPASCNRYSHHHFKVPVTVTHFSTRWTSRRSHRRHDRVQRFSLPHFGLLRLSEGGRKPARVFTRTRTRSVWRDSSLNHTWLDAVGDDARELWCYRG